jgi:hypothetical protein
VALDIYYKEDIENALRAIEHATRQALPEGEQTERQEGYQAGVNAALAAVALAFGLMREKAIVKR